MSTTLPFAPFALRELAEHWQRELSAASDPAEVAERTPRLLQVLLQIIATDPDLDVRRSASRRVQAILDSAPVDAVLLESVAETAREDGDTVLHRRVLELLSVSDDPAVRRGALERLGDLFEQLGDRRAAVDSWKPAALMSRDTRPEREHARRLYERALDTVPDDREAAEQLVQLYADSDEWQRVPEVLGVVVRADGEGAAELLLRFAPNALAAGARVELASMVEEVLALSPPWSTRARELLRVKARALAPLREPEQRTRASEAYRALLQAFGSAADRREYEAHIARLEGEEQLRERRWLYQWRAANESQPSESLLAWATEEESLGDTELAITLLRRALAEPPRRREALESLCRLLGQTGDFVGAFEALEELSRASTPDERYALGPRAAIVLAGAAATLAAEATARRDGRTLLDRVESVGRELGLVDPVVVAYGRALSAPDLDPARAATLGARLVALEGESSAEGSFFVEALARVLELVPEARWAVDRVKLALVLEGHWDELWRVFDRAIAATRRKAERAQLVEEAAFAARDVAHDTERAVAYLDALCGLRPGDAGAAAARREMQRRAAALRLDRGDAVGAGAVLDAMLDAGTETSEVADLLERLAVHPGQERAVARLREHHERAGRIDDAVRVVDAALDVEQDPEARARLARELVRLRVGAAVASAPMTAGALARATALVEHDAAKRPALAPTIHRALLRLALRASKRAPTDADFAEATDAAWRALDALTRPMLDAGEAARACRLLRRGAILPFPRAARRELLRRAAELCADVLGDTRGALRILDEIFRQDSGDAIAVGLVDRFAGLLRAAGQDAERRGDVEGAVAAYDRGAALGAPECIEALARIHGEHGRWTQAAASLEWLVEHSRGPARDRHALRLATAYVELDRSDRARACLEQVLCAGPDHEYTEAVRTQLAALYRRDAVWRPLVDTLAAQAGETANGASRVALLREAAAIARTKLDAPAEAADLLEVAAAADPGDAELRLELAGLLEGLGQWSRVASVLRERIALYGERRSKERALVHHRLARTLVRSGDNGGALAELRLAAKMQPAHAAILHDLGRVALDAGELDLAEQTLRALLLALRRPAAGEAPISSAAVLLELARMARRKGNDARAVDLAESALEAALESGEDPGCFAQALREWGRPDRLARTLVHVVERGGDAVRRSTALRDLGELWATQLARGADLGARIRRGAQSLARELETTRCTEGRAWAALWAVHASLGEESSLLERQDDLAPLLREAIARMSPGPDRARLRVALGAMMASQPAQADAAMELLASALEEAPAGVEASGLVPAYVEAVWRLGDALERAGERARAARLYESVLDRRPTDVDTAAALEARLQAVGSERLADGVELRMDLDASAARALAPRLVALRDAQGDVAGVARALERVLCADAAAAGAPEARPLLRRLVEAYEALGDDRGAVTLLGRALAARPRDAELACMAARARERIGDDTGAAAALLHLVDPDRPQLEIALAMLEGIARRAAPAEVDDVVVGLADLLARAGQLVQARQELDALLTRRPSHVGALERLASLAAAQGSWEQAAEILGRLVSACDVPPDLPHGAPERARLAGFVARLVDACERVEPCAAVHASLAVARPVLLGSTDAPLLLRAARLHLDGCGEPSVALPLIERARAMQPESVEATLAWAQLKSAAGGAGEALAALQEIAHRNGGKRTPALAAVYLAIGRAHLAADELVEALDALKAAFAIDWRCVELALLLGLVALDLGDEKTAERSLLAVAMAPTRAEGATAGVTPAERAAAFYHLAGMARRQGDLGKARRWATKAATDDPGHTDARSLVAELDALAAPAAGGVGAAGATARPARG